MKLMNMEYKKINLCLEFKEFNGEKKIKLFFMLLLKFLIWKNMLVFLIFLLMNNILKIKKFLKLKIYLFKAWFN
jgi:hypothetical protein